MTKPIRILGRAVWIVLMTVISLLFAYPFLYSILGSLMLKEDFGNMGTLLPIPQQVTFKNFAYVFSVDGGIAPLVNSLQRAAWYTLITVAMAMLCGYVLARYEFRGKKFFLIAIVAAQVIPSVLTLIPSYILVSRIPFMGGNNWMGQGGHGLINNKLMLFLPLGWGSLLWVFLFTQSMKSFPRAIEEAAEIDGCTPSQIFWKITMPLIRPILVYVMITSLIGGLQMFDVPQILTNGKGNPDRCATTMIMYLNNHMFSKNYGMAGAVSVVLFLVCAVLCVIVYMALTKEDDGLSKAERKARRQAAKQVKGGKA